MMSDFLKVRSMELSVFRCLTSCSLVELQRQLKGFWINIRQGLSLSSLSGQKYNLYLLFTIDRRAEELIYNSVRSCRTSTRFRVLNGEWTNLWRTVSVIVIREMMRIEIIFETFDQSPFNHLMPLLSRGTFTEFSCRGNFRSYNHDLFSHSSVRNASLGCNTNK